MVKRSKLCASDYICGIFDSCFITHCTHFSNPEGGEFKQAKLSYSNSRLQFSLSELKTKHRSLDALTLLASNAFIPQLHSDYKTTYT